MIEFQIQGTVRKTRRRHHKSRTGCFECKRRRVKCDETKPSCTRCILGLNKCMYPSAPQPAVADRRDEAHILSSSIGIPSPSPSASSHSDLSQSFEASPRPTSAYVEVNHCSNASAAPKRLFNTDLYQHYLQHTSRTLSLCQIDQSVWQIRMPALARQSSSVFHSLLAVSAASLAWNAISREPSPDIDTINQILLTGYQHYNLASERMRESISRFGEMKPEPLIASALMLVPFATASQQINHWISSRSGAQESHRLLSSTPRDVIIIMRGIRTMLLSLDRSGLSKKVHLSSETKYGIDSLSAFSANNLMSIAPAPSRTHPMSAIVATTSRGAFSKLQQRLESALLYQSDCPNHYLSACSAAFTILEQIRDNAFYTTNSSQSPSRSPSTSASVTGSLEPASTISSQIPLWLRSFAGRSLAVQPKIPLSAEPLTRLFLSFLIQVPQEYLDLVLPLLDQRLECPIALSSSRIPPELTRMQALALDIYAHWSVLMLLVEDESWWVGTLPTVTLAGMINRYGDEFVNGLWPEIGPEKGRWWPRSMLNIVRDTKCFR